MSETMLKNRFLKLFRIAAFLQNPTVREMKSGQWFDKVPKITSLDMSQIKDEGMFPGIVTCLTQIGDCSQVLRDKQNLPIMPRKQYGMLARKVSTFSKLFYDNAPEELFSQVGAIETAGKELLQVLLVEDNVNKY